jgi:hypothetical protein
LRARRFEGDIADCFGSLDHEVLLSILDEKIHDNRFEEARRLAGGVRDQGLGFGEFQPEFIQKECCDPRLDLLGFVLGPSETEQPVVGVPDIP